MEPQNSPTNREEKWRDYLAKRMERNSNWIIPVIFTISLGGISFIESILSRTRRCDREIGYLAIFFLVCSILSLLFNLYFDIRWTSTLLKTKNLDEADVKYREYAESGKDDILKTTFDISFWGLIIGIFISIIFYFHVR